MKKILLMSLLMIGCNNSTELEENHVMCSWEYNDGQSGCLLPTYSSISICEEKCLELSQEISDIQILEGIELTCKEYSDTTTCLLGLP